MSLINDALKKAQKQRTGETPTLASMPSVGGESPQRIARRAKPAGFESLMLRAGIGAAVVLVLAVGGFFLTRDKPAAVSAQPSAVSSSTPSSSPASGGPVSAPAASPNVGSPSETVSSSNRLAGGPPSAPPPAPTFTLPVAPRTEQSIAVSPVATRRDEPSVALAKEGAPSAAPSPSTRIALPQSPEPKAETPASAAPPPKLDPRAIEFIENIKVAGIRVSATDPKVLMNDRVYRPGSQVSAEFGLTLVEIATGSLTFEDAAGGRYTRTF